MKDKRTKITAYLGLALMSLIIGFSFIFVKIGLRYVSPVDLLAHRFTAAASGLLIFYLLSGNRLPRFNPKDLFSLLALSLFYPLLLFSMQTIGLQFTTASEAGILSATAPIFTVIMASLFLKEKSSFLQIASIMISVAGVTYIIYRNGLNEMTVETLKGNFFILLSVLAMSFYLVLGRKLTRHIPAMDITFFMTIVACVLFNGISVATHLMTDTFPLYFETLANTEFLWAILYLGVLSSFLTSFLATNALTVIPAPQVSIFNNLSPIIAILGGVLFLNETLYFYHIIGGVMVLAGIVGVSLFSRSD